MIFYIWLLLTLPQDRLVCELWTRELTRAALVQACGTDDLSAWRVDVYEAGIKICEAPGVDVLFTAEVCTLHKKYDAYRLRVVEPAYQTLIGCTVRTETQEQPSESVIRAQCPDATDYEVRYGGTRQIDPQPVPSVCKPPAVAQPATLATYKDLHLLAGKLIWFGLAKSNCPGGLSGVDPETFAATACGMDGARAAVHAWQNSLDASILAAAAEWHVPADLLKSIIERETQYWPWNGTDGEQGLIQLTEDGAGNVLHVYQVGYYRLSAGEQQQARAAWLRSLACEYCTPLAAIEKAKRDMGKYAQALAAYYCMYGSWENAVRAWNVAHQEN